MVYHLIKDALPKNEPANANGDAELDVIDTVDTSNAWISFRNKLANDMYNEWRATKGG